jgi:hypothetical protein
MTAWLKVIGKSDQPLRNDWGSHAPPLLRTMTFSKRSGQGSLVRGDEFVYYALHRGYSRVVAIGRIVGDVYYDHQRQIDPGWPWLAPIEIDAKRDLISDGFPLDRLDVGRTLTRSVMQKSHIRLTDDEFALAKSEFGVT